MIELDDCGRELHLRANQPWADSMDVKVQMVVKAPRGTLVLFDRGYISPDTQCKAIRSFMKEHKDD